MALVAGRAITPDKSRCILEASLKLEQARTRKDVSLKTKTIDEGIKRTDADLWIMIQNHNASTSALAQPMIAGMDEREWLFVANPSRSLNPRINFAALIY